MPKQTQLFWSRLPPTTPKRFYYLRHKKTDHTCKTFNTNRARFFFKTLATGSCRLNLFLSFNIPQMNKANKLRLGCGFIQQVPTETLDRDSTITIQVFLAQIANFMNKLSIMKAIQIKYIWWKTKIVTQIGEYHFKDNAYMCSRTPH